MNKLKLINKVEKVVQSVKDLSNDLSKEKYSDEELAYIMTLSDEIMHNGRFEILMKDCDADISKLYQVKLDIFSEYADDIRLNNILYDKVKEIIKEKIFINEA